MPPVEPSEIRLWYNAWVKRNAWGKVLDVGKSRYWEYGFPTLDIDPKRQPTIVGNIEEAPFKDSSFDMVLCNGMYEFVENPQKMIDEVMRITRDKAIFGFVGKDYKPYRRPWGFYWGFEQVPHIITIKEFGCSYYFMACQWPEELKPSR